jgi:MFS transporter, ACS family, tartrate transporter
MAGRTATERAIIQKLRFRILPFVVLLFVVALIDRNNIGLAALTMNRELAITSQQFGIVFGVFFFGYFLFEIPSNLLLHKIRARVWIARILFSWGLVATLRPTAEVEPREMSVPKQTPGDPIASLFPTHVASANIAEASKGDRHG